MTKLRLLSLIIAITLVISTIPCCVFASAESEPVFVTLSMYSNLSDKKSISGLYKENTFYVSIDNLCEISGAKVEKTENDSVFLSLNQGIRNFEIITTGGGLMKELFYNDSYPITMPVIVQDDVVYISAVDFLHYIRAYYKLSKDGNPQFMVAVSYTIFDAFMDYSNLNCGNYFWWDEVDYDGKSIDNKIINAGVVALLNRDSNVFRMMFDAKGIEQEALEDALISILTNEGISYFDEQNQQSDFMNLANDTLGMTSDYVDFILDFYESDATKGFGEYLGEFASGSANTVNHLVNLVNFIESYKQFEKITDAQRNLLADTIISYHRNSSTLSNGWNIVLKAAKNVDERAKNAYSNKFAEAEKLTKKTGYDMLGKATDLSPIFVAWDGAILINKLIPYTSKAIDKKTQLYNAYNCSIIQLIANELLSEAWSEVYYSDYCGQQSTCMDYLTQVKNALILQLKSTLTTRDCLIKSEYLTEDYVAEMKTMNKETAELLNKTLNCKVVGLGEMAVYSENTDYSWIAEYNDITKSIEGNGGINKNNLLADEDNFEELMKLLEKTIAPGYSFEYSFKDPNAYRTILSELLCPFGGIPLYTFFFNKEPEVFNASNMNFDNSPKSEMDPLQEFGGNYRYARVSADEIDWIIQNIFNVKPNRKDSNIIQYGKCDGYYYEGYYYYSCGDGGDIGVTPVVVSHKKDSNNVYTVQFDLVLNDDYHTYESSGEVVCALKKADGKKQWSLLSVKKIDSTGNKKQEFVDLTPDSIWATLVNNKWVDEEGNEIKFTKNITYYKLKPNAFHINSDYYMGSICTTNSKGYYYGHYLVKDDKELFLQYNTWPNGGMGLLLNENYCWDPSMEKNNSWCMTSDGKIMFSQGRDSFCNKTLHIIK